MATLSPPARNDFGTSTGLLQAQLLEVMGTQSPEQAKLLEQAVNMSKKALEDGQSAPELLQELSKFIANISPEDMVVLADAFGMMLTLENIAEDVHLKHEEASQPGAATRRTKECALSLQRGGKVSAAQIHAALSSMDIDLVFTAHPTQVMRRGMLVKCQAIRSILRALDQPGVPEAERKDLEEQLRLQIHMCWRTDSLRRKPPTPQEEQRSLLSYIPGSIFPAVPAFLRKLDKALAEAGVEPLPLSKTPVRFSSWMGGDRDGNPNVTATVTKDVVLATRLDAARLYFESVQKLMMDLSLCNATPEFMALVDASEARLFKHFGGRDQVAKARRDRGYNIFFAPNPDNEPYRKLLAEVRDRLHDTWQALSKWIAGPTEMLMPAELARTPDANGLKSEVYLGAYTSSAELLEPLYAIHRSLVASGDGFIAAGPLADFIRQVHCFGLSLTALDVRQESTRHSDAMDAITRCLGLGSYDEWPEERRVQFLETELASARPLIPARIMREVRKPRAQLGEDAVLSAEVHEVLATFNMIAQLPMDSFGSYVISMARAASDVLCVRLLQKEFCVQEPMLRVAPLFETLDDLQNAPTSLRTLLQSETYRNRHCVGGLQEVMIGYSDSGKDAGRMAAAWAQYEAQEELLKVAKEFGVELVFFHGRGGTVGRGGGPVQIALRSQPMDTRRGQMRVTIQGETIERQFGELDSACRTMDTYISAMLEAELGTRPPVKDEWRKIMKELQAISCKAYRNVVFEDPRFVAYFRDVTPSAELGRANIGSRPAKRKAVDSVGSIRAIPWIFAWTQTRFNLPVWLGVGDAITSVLGDPAKKALLTDMYDNFMFFRSLIDLLEMVFQKSDPNVAKLYDAGLATSDELKAMGADLGKNFVSTRDAVLALTGGQAAAAVTETGRRMSVEWMKQKVDARNLYITPLNLMQVRCLGQTREASTSGPSKEKLGDAMLLTVKGIAAGLQNTG